MDVSLSIHNVVFINAYAVDPSFFFVVFSTFQILLILLLISSNSTDPFQVSALSAL